jgi:flagellar hook-length control protein FliK
MTSVLNSSSHAAHSVKRLDKSTPSGKHTGAPGDPSGEFGALFGALMDVAPGQDLAAPAVVDGKTSPQLSGLAAEVLGPSVHIITTTEPATSDESLMAFARSQGMDEEALAMIFGRQASDAMASAESADVMAATQLRTQATLAEAAKPTLQAAEATTGDAHTGNGQLDLGQDARISWTLGNATEGKKAGAEHLQSTMFGLNGVRSLLPQAGHAETAKLEQAAHPEAANQTLAASLILGAAEASQFARRMQMKQTTQRAERAADAFPLSTTVGESVSARKSDTPVETLSLETDLVDSDTSSLINPRQPEARLAGQGDGTSAAAGQSAQRTDQGERAEQYDKLSQRLAEALGQRLAAQIAKGDWKVEMALRPIDLGKIDIELKMHQGELQASFNASEASTRDLIVNGLPKLKEILSQLGMEVASVNVNVRQEGQSGGNPTPGKQFSGVAGVAAKRSTSGDSTPTDLPPARNATSSDDGLDVLV